jgi:hypothetical protein
MGAVANHRAGPRGLNSYLKTPGHPGPGTSRTCHPPPQVTSRSTAAVLDDRTGRRPYLWSSSCPRHCAPFGRLRQEVRQHPRRGIDRTCWRTAAMDVYARGPARSSAEAEIGGPPARGGPPLCAARAALDAPQLKRADRVNLTRQRVAAVIGGHDRTYERN